VPRSTKKKITVKQRTVERFAHRYQVVEMLVCSCGSLPFSLFLLINYVSLPVSILILPVQALLSDPALVGTPVNEIRLVASKELKYLEKRSDFWRQQKPVYARQNEQKQKLSKSFSKSAQS
jgi:hypothetical protein